MLLKHKAQNRMRPLLMKAAIFLLLSTLMLPGIYAQNGSPELPSSISNTFVISTMIVMFILLLIIGLLANVLIGAAKYKMEKNVAENNEITKENTTGNNS